MNRNKSRTLCVFKVIATPWAAIGNYWRFMQIWFSDHTRSANPD
jgi:hypothetical protein